MSQEIYMTDGKKFSDPCTGVTACPVMDALDGFYTLPEEVQHELLLRRDEERREKTRQHMADLKAARCARRVKYKSPDLENLKAIADDLFAMCDDFVEKQKAKQKE